MKNKINITETRIRTISKILMILCAVGGFCSLVLFVPSIRDFVIDRIGEKYSGQLLTTDVWHEKIILKEIEILVWDCLLLAVFAYLSFGTLPILEYSTNGIFGVRKELKSIRSSKKQIFAILGVLVILLSVRFFYISQKKSMHVDESLSISICNRNEYGFWGKNYEHGIEYIGKELKEMSLWDNSDVKDALSDVFHMHQTNRDLPHSNFYYTLLRLWFTGVKTSDLQYIFWRGCLLNVIFFLISFFFMTLLIKRFTNNTTSVIFCLFIAFINPASLSLTIFIRPYELQQTFVIILMYYICCCIQNYEKEESIVTKKNFFVGILILSLTMLSAYFNILIIAMAGLCFIIFCIRKKDFNLLRFLLLMFVFSLIFAKLLYFSFGSISDRHEEAAANLALSNIMVNIKAVGIGIVTRIIKNIFFGIYLLCIVFATILTIVQSKKQIGSFSLAFVAGLNILSVFVILYFAPIDMKLLRYIAPLFPIFALNFIFLTKRNVYNYSLLAVVSFILAFSLVVFQGSDSVVEHIDDVRIASYKEIQTTRYPLFIRGNLAWKYATLIPYLSDDCRVIFVSDFSEIYDKYTDKIPCIFINQEDETEQFYFDTKNGFIQQIKSIPYHDIYLIQNR
ncbi:MAG: hypothetical protein J5606_04845 [Bacteroidales bacterium]|nr:hypothetical protein [Bacteroidales bacterium]